jgi:hypothetical protein
MVSFYKEKLLAPQTTPKLEDLHLLIVTAYSIYL